ncbi:protein kinase C and casein kinase substrate in neurons protein 2-like [Brienomyrus brachyistius]|uniref:protein kinase C and casein kinase substrate in neurons protein 2-like n=1 Tax=Brienomyrus brachyistius TaxID=42636 RepID=UPI0020B1F3F2|nr:protein kinase C and casein kinase substrate in neurons protein 2-like [Brienomyrus brachyistius]XP_048871590.1 protein kinase C and casein kinase substrate in neurons protein 2-like [Brienomyrus brachyistius]
MSTLPNENPSEDASNQSFWMPGNYQSTVRRTEDSFQACSEIVACFQERARVERQYAQQLSEWSTKWKPLVDASPLYGSLLRAWQCFLTSADRLSILHTSICRSLVSEDGDRMRTWQKETFHKKMFGGFRESQDFETGFSRAQKPWSKRLKKLDKARNAYHKACRKEHVAQDREAHARGNPDIAIEKQRKIQEEREQARLEKEKVRSRYEKVLEEVTRYAPRYMEEMESIFDQSQEEERKRISFLKQAFLSIHRHLDVTNDENVKAVYSELHHTLMSINEQEDLRWWKNSHGPGMSTDWPHFQEWTAPQKKQKKGKKEEQKNPPERAVMIGGLRVRALYDYVGQEPDELSFKAGDEFIKTEEEDDQGWCRGMKDGGREGLYPANYVEVIQ